MSVSNPLEVVDRSITFTPIPEPDHIKQIVGLGTSSKETPGTWLAMHVRAEHFGTLGGDTTQLADGRPLSELTGNLTLRAYPDGAQSPLGAREDGRAICGFVLLNDSTPYDQPGYWVTLYASTSELRQVAELARTRRLASIRVEFKARLAPSSQEERADAPGAHHSSLGRRAYYVLGCEEKLAIDAARFEFELDRAAGSTGDPVTISDGPGVRHLIAQAHRTLARTVANHPQFEWENDGARVKWDRSHHGEELTPDQIKAVFGTDAGSKIKALIREAFSQGSHAAYRAGSCAVEFIRVNGTIYRARASQAASDKKKKGKSASPITVPTFLTMWSAPRIRADQEMDGPNSLEALDREGLVEVCTQFYLSGVKCSWFEKMLVEALVGAEAYSTLKLSKTSPSQLTGQFQFLRSMVSGWAFSKSKGGPAYQLYVQIGNAAVSLGRLAVFGWFVWWAYSRYQKTGGDWQSIGSLIVLAIAALGWLGRHITQHIVRWSHVVPAQATATMLSTPFGSVLVALLQAYETVSSDTTSITAARDAVRAAMAKGGAIDPIALAFLDRAAEARDHVWARSVSRDWSELDELESTPAQPAA